MLWPRTMRRLWSLEPWEEMERLHRQVHRLFAGIAPSLSRRIFPPVNVWMGHDHAVVTAELPGIDPETLDLTVVGDTLVLNGAREADEVPEGHAFTRQERPAGTFSRTIQLPFRVEPDQVEASYARGILTVTLPRLEADKPKQIAVKANA